MSERYFRIVLGGWLLAAIFLRVDYALYALLALLLFEGITNLRIPILLNRLNSNRSAESTVQNTRIDFEAERALRLIVSLLICIPFFYLDDFLWWLPWFVGFALVGAGMSGICPMVLALRWVGFK